MKLNKKSFFLAFAVALLAGTIPALADDCATIPGNVIANCGFENGTQAAQPTVPNSWTANAGYLSEPSFNNVRTSPVYEGTHALSIGNLDSQPVPELSQTFSDVSGVTYDGSLFVNYGGAGTNDTNVFFKTLIDNTAVVSLDDTAPGNNGSSTGYREYTFSFTATGSDTITLEGNTTPEEWYVDDISVTPSTSSAVPEPGTIELFGAGIMALAGVLRRKGLWTRS